MDSSLTEQITPNDVITKNQGVTWSVFASQMQRPSVQGLLIGDDGLDCQ